MQPHERVLVVLVRSPADWEIARTRHWYRLPLRQGPRGIAAEWIAFYEPGAFGSERWGVHSYARVHQVDVVRRIDLFPHEPGHPRAQQPYHVISFDPPVRLARPLVSDHGRRFVWTMTTWWRFTAAESLDDLFAEEPIVPSRRESVLVGIVPNVSDMEIARERRWYRVPRNMVEAWRTPGHLAFYYGQAFGDQAGQIRHYAEVSHADVVPRIELFPDQPRHPRAHHEYIRIHLGELQQRPAPIQSRHRRRIVLLPTTWDRFAAATDLNDLVAGDPAEETLYGRLTGEGMRPERAYYVRGANAYYLTDFALFCRRRNVQVDLEPGDGTRLLVTYPDGRTELAEGWAALRLSRFDITRRQEESVEQVRSLVAASGGIITA